VCEFYSPRAHIYSLCPIFSDSLSIHPSVIVIASYIYTYTVVVVVLLSPPPLLSLSLALSLSLVSHARNCCCIIAAHVVWSTTITILLYFITPS